MKTLEISALIGNKYIIPGHINDQKIYRRTFTYLETRKEENAITVFFDANEANRLKDYFNRIDQSRKGMGSDSYYLHFPSDNSWFESIIIEQEADLAFTFNISGKNEIIGGSAIDI
ncbi:MAG: hypothetical protein H6Q17_525 [Bacteroidetes bacterium]|nr:hypothetical protein [Bacteroidota bacterium]